MCPSVRVSTATERDLGIRLLLWVLLFIFQMYFIFFLLTFHCGNLVFPNQIALNSIIAFLVFLCEMLFSHFFFFFFLREMVSGTSCQVASRHKFFMS